MLNSSLTIILGLILIGCERQQQEVKPSYPDIISKPSTPTPTPPVYTGWIKIQNDRWTKAQIRPEKLHFAQSLSISIQKNKTRYTTVETATNVPWKVIGCLHNMEASLNFRCNLGQGDPLTSQSRHVPAGRPPIPPKPPFTWEYAAEDALRFDKMSSKNWNDIGNELQNIEGYNGLGYQKYHKNVPSPYLWSWTSEYSRGKYISDGTWSDTSISEQCGVVPLLKLLQ